MKLNRVRRRRRDLLKVDRLIKLPDDLLLNILERVGTLDALRACLISKRMLKLPAKLSQIDIVLGTRDMFLMNDVVAEVVDKILTITQIPVRKLKVSFILRLRDCLSIGKSVAFAMATQKQLDAAEFEISAPETSRCCTNVDHFLRHFGTQLNTFIRECPDAFAGLTRLHLQCLRFGKSDIPNILSTCKRLESLSFFQCDAGVGSVLQVEHARLVEIDIKFGNFRTVELNILPRLQRISYNSWSYPYDPLVLGFVPQLSKLALSSVYRVHTTLRLSHLLVNVPSISDLYLGFQSEKIWIQPECQKLLAPLLRQLRLVNLDTLPEGCDIAWTMFFLEAAPSLQELCIIVWDHECQRQSQRTQYVKTNIKWEPSVADLKHMNLAKLTIHGFRSDDKFTKYVRRILEAAVNIKEVSLHDRKLCKVCTSKLGHLETKVPLSRYPQTDEEKDLSRKKITEALVTASPAVIQFRPACHYSAY